MIGMWRIVLLAALLASASVVSADTTKSEKSVPAHVEVTGSITVNDVTIRPVDQTQLPCDPPKDLRGSDLCAQWKAADAARDSANWSMVSAVVSVITLGAIAFGFWQTQDTQQREYRAYIKPV